MSRMNWGLGSTSNQWGSMNSEGNILIDFELTLGKITAFLELVGATRVTFSHVMSKRVWKKTVAEFGKELAEHLMIYFAYMLSVQMRKKSVQRTDWKKIRELETLFVQLVNKADHVTPLVLERAFIITHYWKMTSHLGPTAVPRRV